MIRISELKLSLDQAIRPNQERENLIQLILKKYGLSKDQLQSFSLYKKAVDARKKDDIRLVYSVNVELTNERKWIGSTDPHIKLVSKDEPWNVEKGAELLKDRPVIVGFGPSGIFAALLLAMNGYRPIVLEKGYPIEERELAMKEFYQTKTFTEKASILFGEGGAGTYSDGKLTTLINDPRCRFVIDTLIHHGANPEIGYAAKPHVGTDELRKIIVNIRKTIIQYGGTIRFETEVTDFVIDRNQLNGIIINQNEVLPTHHVLLGTGHSARPVFYKLYDHQVNLEPKPFSVGVRIEHEQAMINASQYGKFANHPALGAADYKLSYHGKNRSAYTFCMCPGGYVVCATSESGGVVTNGMSEAKRDGKNANSALLVSVTPADFPTNHPLSGIDYQRALEEKAFLAGNKTYCAPVQCVGDFLENRKSVAYGNVKPSYQPGVVFADFNQLFPKEISETLKEALIDFDHKLKGFASKDALLTGVETRSSSPVRILRNESFESSVLGLFPMGEGAGYAGGIMSAAVDGMKVAENIIKTYAPFN